MTSIRTGEIFEILTPKGKGYLHCIYKDPGLGEFVRVLQGLYPEKVSNFESLAASKERYMIIFPLAAAAKRKIVEKAGFYQSDFSKPRFMRSQYNVGGECLGWHIVETDTWQRTFVKSLTREQMKLSPWGIWNDTLLIERLVSDWNLEKWK